MQLLRPSHDIKDIVTLQKKSTVVVSTLNGILVSFATGRCFGKYLRIFAPDREHVLKSLLISPSKSANSIAILQKLMNQYSETNKSEHIMQTKYRFTHSKRHTSTSIVESETYLHHMVGQWQYCIIPWHGQRQYCIVAGSLRS